jgi:PTH1 family peptidyl-tRNA hydrolase
MKLIVGLGNPGSQYAKNRHNIGFQCVDALAAQHDLRFDVKKGNAKVALGTLCLPAAAQAASTAAPPVAEQLREGQIAARAVATVMQRVALAKPQTYMNAAGRSVVALARFYKIAPGDILVIFDDLDLPLGKLRLRPAGGSGGHNGMKSIIRELGTEAFPRLRIGIDRPPGRMDPADYVLQDFSAAQQEVVDGVRGQAAAACEHWLAFGMASAMNAFN